MSRAEMLRELTVMREPPVRGPGEDQILRAPRVEVPEMGDRLDAVGGMMTCVQSGVVPRKVPCPIPLDAQQRVITPARDQHDGAMRHVMSDAVTHPLDERAITIRRQPCSHASHFAPAIRRVVPDKATIVAGACSSASAP